MQEKYTFLSTFFLIAEYVIAYYIYAMTGKDLQTWRRSRDLSVRHIADALGVSPRTVETWETRGVIPAKKILRVQNLMTNETILLRLGREVFLKLEERAKAKGYASADAYAAELFEKLL